MARLGFLLPVVLLLLLLLLLLSAVAQGTHAVVRVVSETWSKDYCVLFSADYVTLPRELRHAPLLPLHDGTKATWCPGKDPAPQAWPSSSRPQSLRHTTTMALRGNCSFHAKGQLAQGRGAHGLLIVSRLGDQHCSDHSWPSGDPHRPLPGLAIPVAVLRYTDMLDILRHTHGAATIRIAMYAPPMPIVDYNLVVIFVLAVGTVAVGGYWAGLVEAAWLQRRRARGGGGGPAGQLPALVARTPPGLCEDEDTEGASVNFTLAAAGTVVAMSCSIVALLYLFYDCFIYVMIGVFSLGATTGLYSCLVPLLRHLPLPQCQWPLPGCRACLQLPQLLLAVLCAAVTLLWVAYRHEDRWAWLLQDALGMAYCLLVLRRVRLPTLRNCSCFLLVLLALDVFFVFVTPLFTKTGESIMLEIASGPADSSSREKLPMVLRVPQLRSLAVTPCDQPFSILGFGDIVVPGFLVAYCHRFDVHTRSRQLYFVACTIAYAMGLLVTFLAMVLMETGQPALLYLVSSTLLTSLTVAVCRRELSLFWTGWSRAQTAVQPLAGLCVGPEGFSEQRQASTVDGHVASKLEGATEQGAGNLDSSSGADAADTGTFSEGEAASQEGHGENSEASLDALPPAASMAVEDLRPLMPLPSELGHVCTQAPEASLSWEGLHRRKGLKVKKAAL
ncbi:signal peptide peptidase-like 2C [Octodon degus]|uniref:Signal peptide peptidase-like 2C n=1 Tax=Octodon degus TaxID=10160 RepID=A0A6P3F225_OCTDE|nr:signal peptide peptidase-like 2C [Octodon degus]